MRTAMCSHFYMFYICIILRIEILITITREFSIYTSRTKYRSFSCSNENHLEDQKCNTNYNTKNIILLITHKSYME